MSILLGNGDGTFRRPTLYAAGNYPVSVIAGDFNGDGQLDLAVADDGDLNGYAGCRRCERATGQRRWHVPTRGDLWVGSGPASWWLATSPATAPRPRRRGSRRRVSGSPYENDPGGVYVLLGNGDGTFQTATVYASGGGATEPGSIVAGDFTGDGQLDLAVASDRFDELLMLLGNGDGTFQPPNETPLNLPGFGQSVFLSIVAGDFNRDGQLDLAVADDTSNGSGSPRQTS